MDEGVSPEEAATEYAVDEGLILDDVIEQGNGA